MPSSRRRPIIAALLALTGLFALAPSAGAGPIVDSAPDCRAQPLAQTFAPWLDPAYYTPLPAGTFEGNTKDWVLEGGADVVEGNHTLEGLQRTGDERSLSLPAGGVATSPSICVGLVHPTMRFVLRSTSGLPAAVTVEVLFEDTFGEVHALPVGLVPARDAWAPGPPVLVVANLLPLLPGERTAVAFRFRTTGGDVAVDEIHVDPWRMR